MLIPHSGYSSSFTTSPSSLLVSTSQHHHQVRGDDHIGCFPNFARTKKVNNKSKFSSCFALSSSSTLDAEFDIDSSETNLDKNTSEDSSSPHKNFDYLSHWYPVVWSHDLELDRPTKITLFDVDYAVAKIQKEGEEEEAIAMVDACPHKSAALSEGRITKCGKSFQCAYHGWTFDSKTGECIDIPQVAPNVNADAAEKDEGVKVRSMQRKSGMDLKANGVAVPAMIVNNMVWIFPGGGMEKALLAPPPPTVPDLEEEGFRQLGTVIRDFPVDWTILIENIMDPDHGLFAHQNKPFDLYSASKTNPQIVEETKINNGKGWSVTSKVEATYELLQRNEEEEMTVLGQKKKRKFSMKEGAEVMKSTTTFVAPSLIYMGRRNDANETSFVSAFYVTPTGIGKSRFMSCQVGKVPGWFNLPRWFLHVTVNNFLDQDTYLLATQQRHVLARESELSMKIQQNGGTNTSNVNIPVRKSLYKYRSPTEKLGSKVGNWLDATISRVPNRFPAAVALGGYKSALAKLSMTRNEVLDRYSQHTAICKDSMQLVKKCQAIRKVSKVMAFMPVFFRLLMSFGTGGGRSGSILQSLLLKVNRPLTSTSVLAIWVISAIVSYLSQKLENEFKYKYTEDYRDKDMDKIPSVWMDRL